MSVRLGDLQVLDDVSFVVPAGRVVGLLGPNGAGKTTVMRVLFGIVPADTGEVRWGEEPADQRMRARWGYMPQERGLYMKMRVRDLLVYFGRIRGLGRGAAGERADELIRWVGLEERAGDKVERLSGGMQQRVQLAATLVHDPPVLVLDEPFTGLDPVAVEQMSEVIAGQAASGRTVVFSSHQLDLVEDLCESIVLMDGGRVVLEGDLGALKAASGRRVLRIGIDRAPAAWAERLDGVSVAHTDANETLLELEPGTDPLAILDRVRGLGEVRDFGLELPRLGQLFREAVQR
ncbi:MAG TPA: ATP-binding cassette domain-containing protein [Acidimicrobiales bacterium]|nr:ATP-binding cassette domain-containing protein [Acidimicrobiales bacterium]